MGPLDPIVTAGKDEEYEVESFFFFMHCQREQAMKYLVHWCGYDKAENSCISEQDFVYAQQILQ